MNVFIYKKKVNKKNYWPVGVKCRGTERENIKY